MTDTQLLALILGGTCLYAWMLWHLATTVRVTRRERQTHKPDPEQKDGWFYDDVA